MNKTDQPRRPLAILAFYTRDYKRTFFSALGFALVNQIFLMIDPLIFKHILDQYVMRRDHWSFRDFLFGMISWLTVILGAALIAWVARGFQISSVCTLSQRVSSQMYTDGMSHSLDIPYAEFERRRSGDTVDHLQRTRREVELFLATAVNTIFTSIVGLTFVVIYAALVHWSVGLFVLIAAPSVMIISILLSRKVRSLQGDIVERGHLLAGSVSESLRNIELVKSLGLTTQEVSRFRTSSNQILNLELRKIKYARIYSLFHGAGVNFIRVSLILLLACLLAWRQITVGQFFSLFLYSYFVLGPMQEFGTVVNQYRELEASLIAFQKLLDHPKEMTPVQPVSFSIVEDLEFDGVGFAYASAHRPAVQEIRFRVSRGETIALVGPSGAGKSTLVKLLTGLYSPSEGRILFNGIPSSNIDWNDLRNRSGLVTQETHLFAGTIRQNLTFVAPQATEEECLLALSRAAALPLVHRGRFGLETTIGEGGMQLSGGERQRLAIARALLRQPQLLIFDEATSALDSLTEQEIGETIRNLAVTNNIITIVISHRLATVIHADRIYALAGGRIVETGTHQDLMARNGLYRSMWQRQLGNLAANLVPQSADPVT